MDFDTIKDSIGFVTSYSDGLTRSYQFIDRNFITGTYYRLKMVDKDGLYEYSPLKYVSLDKETINSLSVYPNPVRESFVVTVKGFQSGVIRVTLSELSGKIVYESLLENNLNGALLTHNINVNNITAGIYLLSLTKETGEKRYQKIYIEN